MPTIPTTHHASPVFIGYTEYGHDTTKAYPIYSLAEFESQFGGPCVTAMTVRLDEQQQATEYTLRNDFLLYDSVRLFFQHGGMRCYVVSVGDYTQAIKGGDTNSGLLSGLALLGSWPQANLLLMPDAALLATSNSEAFHSLFQDILTFCSQHTGLTPLIDASNAIKNATHPIHNLKQNIPITIQRVNMPDIPDAVYYSPWIATQFALPLKLSNLKFTHDGKSITPNTLDNRAELAPFFDALDEATDNIKRVTKSIQRRQRGEPSLTHRFNTLLTNYLATTHDSGENLPLHYLLLFLKGLAEMINNWICACTLDEVLSGEMIDIIRQTIIPDIATQGLPDLITLHHRAIDTNLVDSPVTGYYEMFCLTSCIGSNCPWQKTTDDAHTIHLSDSVEENAAHFSRIFDHFDDAIRVIIELTEQFELDTQEQLLNQSEVLQQLYTDVMQSRYVPPGAVVAAKVNSHTPLPQQITLD